MRRIPKARTLLLVVALVAAGCAGPPVQPLMPTPVLFTELGIGPLDHIPEHQRWNHRRVYYATTREREDDLQRIDYGNAESDAVSVGMTLIGRMMTLTLGAVLAALTNLLYADLAIGGARMQAGR